MQRSDKPNANIRRLDYVDTITVLVGAEEAKVIVHEEAITRCSDFFRAACSGNFKEAKEKLVRLPAMEVDTFKSYTHWIYTGDVVFDMDCDDSTTDSKHHKLFMDLVKLYIAADSLGDMRLRNSVIDRLIATEEAIKKSPGPEMITLAYEATPTGSNLRKLLVDYYLRLKGSNATWFEQYADYFPKAFLIDYVYNNMARYSEEFVRPSRKNRCKYHEHNDEVPKCETS